ncbi:MAG: CoA transferase [Chloroflexi bacterium]|nr:CoA transferase [Chloroflexota bacterium]
MEKHLKEQPLGGIRIIDLSHGIAGPYATKLLADFGADVIKVERPGTGDYARRMGPFPGDVPHPEKSGIFLLLNTNKRGITLDLKTAGGVEALKELVKGADVLVESFRPGVMDRLGLGYKALKEVNPNLVMTSISNFGQTGPYRDYLASELTLFGMGNKMHSFGLPERHPLKLGGNLTQYQAGNVGAMATLFAYYARKHRDMGGQHVDVSILETSKGSITTLFGLVGHQYNGEISRRLGDVPGRGYPNGYYPCKDGYVSVQAGGNRWRMVADLLEMPELLDDPRFAPPDGQRSPEGKEEFERTIWLPWLMERTGEQVMEECQRRDIPSVVIYDMAQVVDQAPQLASRGYFTEIDHSVAGKFRYPGAPIFNSNGWWQIRRPAPLLGQHTQEVLVEELGYSQEDVMRLAEGNGVRRPTRAVLTTAASNKGSGNGKARLPLEGIRVIDITLVGAAIYGTMFLADMGAEVIQVEPLNFLPIGGRGQWARPSKEAEAKAVTSSYPDRDPGERPWNRVASKNSLIRNKYSMTADLATPEGRDAFRRLVEVSDLFIENVATGSMERRGVHYPVVSQWNPRLIMISSTGPGQTGPWRYFRGPGSAFEALFGHGSVLGYPDMGMDGYVSSIPSDTSTGVTITNAALLALHQRERTGKGMYVDIGMGENFLPHLGELVMDYTINGRVAGRMGNRDHLGRLVQGAYQCAGDDEWIAITIGKIEQWYALCRLMGKPELIEDRRFKDMDGLRSHHDDVDQIISSWTAYKDPFSLFHLLQGDGIIAGPLLHEAHSYNDPHLKDRGFFVPVTAPEVGTHLYPGTVYKMSNIPFEVRRPPVRLGEDNDYVYREVLGFSEEEYDHMKALGQVGMDYLPHVK